MTNTRSAQRLYALGCILTDGLNYSWFDVEALDDEAVTATLNVDTGDVDDNDQPIVKRVEITADDVARGLRMYEEALNGQREFFPGAWKYDAKDAVRAGVIANVDEFVPTVHARVDADAYARQTVKFSRTNGDEGDYDANTADSVLQFATLGHVIFG